LAKYNAANPFEPISTPFRARQAAAGTPAAAFTLAGLNVLTGVLIYFVQKPTFTLIGTDRTELGIVHLCVAVLAAALGFAARRRETLTLSWIIVAWCVVEVLRLTGPLYAHAAAFPIGPFALLCAIQGLRGVMAGRRLSAHPPEMFL
jgi:hypothetical protein